MSQDAPVYDTIGDDYATQRRPDPRWIARIHDALGPTGRVVNVGAGAGSYEPVGRVVALEPSPVMLAQRPADAAPAVRGVAEHLPFPDDAFETALAVLTVHHWTDAAAGLAEMQRVARRQVIVTWDPEVFLDFWLVRDYIPEAPEREADVATVDTIAGHLRSPRRLVLPVPADCTDGFFGAYWRRPHAYLDPAVRAAISGLALLEDEIVEPAMRRLAADLESGAWQARYAELASSEVHDLGYRMLVAER